jgi:hypothetical protein
MVVDSQDRLPTGAMIVPVICKSEETHLTNFSGDQHVWPWYVIFGNIQKDIHRRPENSGWIRVRQIPCRPKGAKNIDKPWHSAVGTVLAQLRHLDITSPGLKWAWADGFQRQCYPLLAAWVGYHPEQVMIAQVLYC